MGSGKDKSAQTLQVRGLLHVSPEFFPDLWSCVSAPGLPTRAHGLKYCPPRPTTSGEVPAYSCVMAPYETSYVTRFYA